VPPISYEVMLGTRTLFPWRLIHFKEPVWPPGYCQFDVTITSSPADSFLEIEDFKDLEIMPLANSEQGTHTVEMVVIYQDTPVKV